MDENTHLSNVLNAEASVLSFFEEKWDNADRNSSFYALDHWTEKEKSKFAKQKRIPYVFDKVSHAINIILGTQRDTRFDLNFYAREEGDEVKAEIYNALWKYYSDLYNYISVESDVYQDGVIGGYGVFGLDIDKDNDPRGDVRVSRVPSNLVLWDRNARQYDLSDAYWFSRVRFFRRGELMKKFPEQAKLIETIGSTDNVWANRGIKSNLWFDVKKNLIGIREFYEKDWVEKYCIWQIGSDAVGDISYDTKEEAVQDIQQRMMIAMQAFNVGQLQEMPQFEIIPTEIKVIKKSIVSLNGVLQEPTEFRLGKIPYSVFFAYFNDGDFWSVVDRLKDPQRFLDRMMSQVDHWIGTMSKGLLVGDRGKITDDEWKEVQDKWGKTGGSIRVKGGAASLQAVSSPAPAPQLFSMIDRVDALMDNSIGGANFLGLKQTASESGRAVLARQSQAGLDNFVLLDNLRRTKHDLGKNIAWMISNEVTAPRTMRIIGDKLSMELMQNQGIVRPSSKPNVGFLDINTEPHNSVMNVEIDVVVDEAPHTTNKNQATLAAITDLGKAFPNMPPPPPEVMIELSDAPESIKQVWLASVAQQKNMPPPPPQKVSANYKDLPIESQLQFLQKEGIPASPQGVAIKEVITKPHLTAKEEQVKTQHE